MRTHKYFWRFVNSAIFGCVALAVWYLGNKYVYHNMHVGYNDIFIVALVGYWCGRGDGDGKNN